jgi:methylated-DNA-[protein]-cysteine S-methyltransferase
MVERTARASGQKVSSGADASLGAERSVDVAVGSLPTPVGRLSVAVSQAGVTGIRWCEPTELISDLPVVAEPSRVAPVLEQLAAYFAGALREFDLRLDIRGVSTSSRLVLQMLYDSVPYGSSVTYGELAHRSNTGIPARGIGAIMGSNPLPIVIPCHRVLSRGGLGGYSGGRSGEGLQTKRWLLTVEGVLPPPLGWTQPTGGARAIG